MVFLYFIVFNMFLNNMKKEFIRKLTHNQLIELAKNEIKEWKKFLKDLKKIND